MKKSLIFLLTLLVTPSLMGACVARSILLGDSTSSHTWLYLCGLASSFESETEKDQRKKLDRIGLGVGIKIIALEPPERCKQYDNSLCWPHESKEKVRSTLKYINEHISLTTVKGIIGFSNGGFFLNYLVQLVPLSFPVISIGSYASFYKDTSQANYLYLFVGEQDRWHHDGAVLFAKASTTRKLDVKLVVFKGGHEIPEKELTQTLVTLTYSRFIDWLVFRWRTFLRKIKSRLWSTSEGQDLVT